MVINLHFLQSPPLILWTIGLYFIHPESGNWSVFLTSEQLNRLITFISRLNALEYTKLRS